MSSVHNSAVALRPYRGACIDALDTFYGQGGRRALIVLPTGAGKTIIFSEVARRHAGRTLVIAYRHELLEQAVGKIGAALGDPGTVGIVQAGRDECSRRVVVASIQTIQNPRRLERLGRFGLVIADEGHHAAAPIWLAALERLGCFEPDGPLLLGVTATPDRADGETIAHTVFEKLVYSVGLLDLMRADPPGPYLCDLRAIEVRIDADLGGVHTRSGDLVAGELAEVLARADAPAVIARAVAEHAPDRRSLCFTPTVAMAEAVAACRLRGIAAESLSGATPPQERAAILARLRSGRTALVANCAVLTEGFDCPSIDAIILARPTKSRPLLMQMIGRGLRTHPGKRDCLVLDLVATAGRHDIATVPNIFGLAAGALTNGVSAVDAVWRAELEAGERERRIHLIREQSAVRMVARDLQLLRTPPRDVRPWHAGRLRWLEVAPDATAVVAPGGCLLAYHDGGAWHLLHSTRAGTQHIGSYPSEAAALAAGEREVERAGGIGLAFPNAGWRSRPAGAKQMAFAIRRRLRTSAGPTAGEISDLLTVADARRLLLRGGGVVSVAYDAAATLVAAGWSLIPVGRDKRPLGYLLPPLRDDSGGVIVNPATGRPRRTWVDYQRRQPTDAELRRWFLDRPDCWPAVVYGAVSCNAEAIDFGTHAGDADPYPGWRQLLAREYPELAVRLVVAATPSGGHHAIYRCPEVAIAGNQVLAARYHVNPVDRMADRQETLIETRGEGGCGLLVPAPGYRYEQGDHGHVRAIGPDERAILHRLAALFTTGAPRARTYAPPGGTGVGDGPADAYNRDATVGGVADLLARHGWRIRQQTPDRATMVRPGKGEGEGGNVAVVGGLVLLYCFSGNAWPFEPGRAYTPFRAYGLLEHGGDFAAAGRAYRQGMAR